MDSLVRFCNLTVRSYFFTLLISIVIVVFFDSPFRLTLVHAIENKQPLKSHTLAKERRTFLL